MKIYAVRHGQTDWNLEGKMQGQTDIPLNQAGIKQAEKLAKRFKDTALCKVYTSDLSRAHETARIINIEHNVKVVADAALREMSHGEFEGKNYLDAAVSEELDRFRKNNQTIPGGEPIDVLFARVYRFLDLVISGEDKNLLLVSHAVTIRAMCCYFLGLPIEARNEFRTSNTAVYCFEKDPATGEFRMSVENDTSHLAEYDE